MENKKWGKIMKIFKKILASTLALFISASFVFGGFTNNSSLGERNVAYAASAVEAQRDQLKLALADAAYVRSTQSYRNASKKDIDAYEAAIKKGQAIVNKENATGQELFDATKNIDLARKHLPTSANIILIKASIQSIEEKLAGIEYLEKKMPNSVKRYKNVIEQAKKDSKAAVAKARAYLKQYEK